MTSYDAWAFLYIIPKSSKEPPYVLISPIEFFGVLRVPPV